MVPAQGLKLAQVEGVGAGPWSGALMAGSFVVIEPKNGPLQGAQMPPPSAQVAGVMVSDQHCKAPTKLFGTKSWICNCHTPLSCAPVRPSRLASGLMGRKVPRYGGDRSVMSCGASSSKTV